MTNGSGDRRSSPFDRMLDENRRQFDALLTRRAPHSPPRPAETAAPLEPSAPPATPPTSAPPAALAGEPFDIADSELGRTLARRFGGNWRFEIVDKRRDGTDVVVWARLVAGDHDKTRRGRARIESAGEPAAILGSAGDTGFMLRTAGAGADPAAAEAAATDAAIRQALAACAKGL